MVAVSPFVPGLHLNADFDNEVVGSPHGSTPAGRIGPGSDVLGLDTARSTARGWGPQLKAFVAPADVSAVTERFSERLPDSFAGRPARYGWDRLPNKDHVGVAIRVDRVTGQIGVDPTVGFDTIHRLLIPQRKLLEVTGGGVYHDPDRYFACRQITRLDEQSGHQTRVITTRDDPDAALVAHEMWLSRWREEPFFRYMRAHYGHDALDAYETTPDDAGRLVANPARRDADRKVREAAGAIAAAEEHEGRGALEGQSTDAAVRSAFADAYGELDSRVSAARAIPSKIPLGQVRPGAVRLDAERKRIMDAIRMATYDAESALARLIAPHYARAEDEARSLLHEMFRASGDLQIDNTTLHVSINPLSAPRRTRALAELCEELTATATPYPGTNLTLAYSVKEG